MSKLMKTVKSATKGKSVPGMAKYAGPVKAEKKTVSKPVSKAPLTKTVVKSAAAAPKKTLAAPAPAKKVKKDKTERIRVWSPRGRFSYPWLASVDSGRTYSDDAYKTDLLILKPEWQEHGSALKEAVMQVGRDAFGTKFKIGGPWRTPFKDTDKDDKIVDETQKNCILIRAKSKPARQGRNVGNARQPIVLGPRKDAKGNFPKLTQEEIEAIKGGDWGKIYCDVFAYDQSGGGVTFGLNAVQFWREGDPFGQGLARLMETVEEMEEEEVDEVEEEDLEDEGPADDTGEEDPEDEDGEDDGEEEVEESDDDEF